MAVLVGLMAFKKDSSEELSDADTEETLIHPVSSEDSDSDMDETASLASSVAELSSGELTKLGCQLSS